MKKLFKKLARINKQIAEIQLTILNAPTLPYYTVVATSSDLDRDLNTYSAALADLINYKLELLNKIEDAAGVEIRELKKQYNVQAA